MLEPPSSLIYPSFMLNTIPNTYISETIEQLKNLSKRDKKEHERVSISVGTQILPDHLA